MLKPINLRADYSRLTGGNRGHIIASEKPVISWGAMTDEINAIQISYRVMVQCANILLWDSGWVQSSEQFVKYDGKPLPEGERISFNVTMIDNQGNMSEQAENYFINGRLEELPSASWITASEDIDRKPIYFRKTFSVKEKVISATLYVCGLGYHKATINGKEIDNALLDPAVSDYAKGCYYSVIPEIERDIQFGENTIGIIVADGWRRNNGAYLGDKKPQFFGAPRLWAALKLTLAKGMIQWIHTDPTWQWGRGAIYESHLFDGETYHANYTVSEWNKSTKLKDGFGDVTVLNDNIGELRPMVLEPIVEKKVYEAISMFQVKKGEYVLDFGQNIAGVIRWKLPKSLKKGQKLTVKHMEFLKEDGTLFLENLRTAKATDTYIASGDERDLTEWQPTFVYHGFRYIQISGVDMPEKEDICAVAIYTDLDTKSYFRSGSAILNKMQEMVVQTERSNLHSILTDCPQRDERMGWMNDATVRFEETPYNFDIGRIFSKIIQDLADEQAQDGGITCTAPFLYGHCPADPVCSSYLVAGMQALLHTGNLSVIEKAYDSYRMWEACLGKHSEDYIVNYSHYGDWAAAAYACEGGAGKDGNLSVYVPGILMSTGYYYYNAKLLAQFSAYLGKTEQQVYYHDLAEKIQEAFLKKWYHDDTGKIDNGSQGCQAFSLWLEILPEHTRKKAAKIMRDDLVEREYQFTTGNLCTRYLLDMLAKYSYADEFYHLLTKESYPSIGYMIQNEATTVWERFELKKSTGMNSHNHPMYGALGYCFYAYLAGIRPKGKAFEEVEIQPIYPEKLLSVQANVQSVKGDITVRWVKQFGKCQLFVNIPFNVKANIHTPAGVQSCGSGFWHFEWELNEKL